MWGSAADKEYRIPRGEILVLFGNEPLGGASVARPPFWSEKASWTIAQTYIIAQ